MEMKKNEILEQKMCRELELLGQKYQNMQGEMSVQDLEKIDKLYHALKSMATYNAMKEAEEYGGEGYSGRRGRNPMNGQYISRNEESYADGYSNGYSEAMNQMNNGTGHYPMMPRYPSRW